MSHTERLQRSPQAFRQLTGITPFVFDQLLADLTPRYEQAEAKRKIARVANASLVPVANTPSSWPIGC